MRKLTDEQRNQIVRRYDKGEPLKTIAYDFGTYASFVSDLAMARGRQPRYHRRAGTVTVRLRNEVLERLAVTAKETHTSRDVIVREAIAAYLGLDQ